MLVIDLNMDAGESFGLYRMEQEASMMPYVSSINIACGFHAGDPQVMAATVELAKQHQVAIGAHPGLPDLQGFGRRAMALTEHEVYNIVLYQIGALAAFVRAAGGELRHVKPHGALYHMACEQPALAAALVSAMADLDRKLLLFAPASSELALAAHKKGLRCVREAFVDRAYETDGRLSARHLAGAVLTNVEQAAHQAVLIATERKVQTRTGELIPIQADTLCIHSDTAHAEQIVQAVRSALQSAYVDIRAPWPQSNKGYDFAT